MNATQLPRKAGWLTLTEMGLMWRRSEKHSRLAIRTLVEANRAETKEFDIAGKRVTHYRLK